MGSGDQRTGVLRFTKRFDGIGELVRAALPALDRQLQIRGLDGCALHRLDGGMGERLADDGDALHGLLGGIGSVELGGPGPAVGASSRWPHAIIGAARGEVA